MRGILRPLPSKESHRETIEKIQRVSRARACGDERLRELVKREIDPINEIIAGSAIDVDRAHGALLPVPMEEQDGCCCVVGNRIKDKLRARNMVKPRSQTRDRPRLRVQLRRAPTRSGTSIKDTK